MSPPSWGRSRAFRLAVAATALAAAVTVAAAGLGALVLATRPRSAPRPADPTAGARASTASTAATTTTATTTTAATTAGPTAVPTDPPPQNRQPEQVAAAFTVAFLSFGWDEAPEALRRRCRPWDTDVVDAALAWPGMAPDRDRRAASHETDQVAVDAVSPQDRAIDHLDVTVAAAVTLARPGRPTQLIQQFLDLRVTSTPAGWAVDQVSQ